jgi:hypothetical protein
MKWPTRLVWIEWVDSYSEGSTVWKPEKELVLGDMIHQSVGWVQDEGPDWISIVPHVGLEGGKIGNISGHLAIPKCAIKKIRTIRLK